MKFLSNFFKLFGFGNSNKDNFEQTVQTTLFKDDALDLANKYETNEKKIVAYIKHYPKSSVARYLYAAILIKKDDVTNARKQFMLGMKIEKEYQTTNLNKDEKALKKRTKARIEKKLGYKL